MNRVRQGFGSYLNNKNIRPFTCRFIFSRTGIWPSDRELTLAVKCEAEDYWKRKYASQETLLLRESQKPKKYVLAMFPYPSGKLHMGHVRVYAISDSLARFYHLRGFKVIHPMGWDAFGLPAENAAIENDEMPDKWTYANISQMKAQLLDLGCKFDWDREFATCDPSYYKWTQYIFLLLFRAGLAYQQEALVNWDPVDQTVLANEQVDENGRSWRSGAIVEKKYLRQWFIKTTRFSKSLWDGLSNPLLEYWQDIPKIQQHWIGQCDGYRVEMKLAQNGTTNLCNELAGEKLHLWMSQPEHIHGISFLGIRSDHRLNKTIYLSKKIDSYQLLNVMAICPVSKRHIPLIVCDELAFSSDLDFYIGIPSINDTDHAIARICGFSVMTPIIENGTMVNSGELDGLALEAAREKVVNELLKHGCGGYETSAKLGDWLISRQRYWGTPIPIVHCPSCGTVPVPVDELPVELPKIKESLKKGASPLKTNEEWRSCQCPQCGTTAERETDTMDTFADSSWYFLRFLDPHNKDQVFAFEKQHADMPVDVYVGGKEHASLHMYYARFIQHFLASEGLVSHLEPFRRLVVQGMVVGPTYKVQDTGRYLSKGEVDFSVDPPVERDTGASLEITHEKMSKSKKNGIDPQSVLDEYGADTMRLLMLANYAPFSQRSWSEETFPGVLGWQNRIWLTVSEFIEEKAIKKEKPSNNLSEKEMNKHRQYLFDIRNRAVRGATFNIQETHQLSTSISFMQSLTVALRKVPKCMMLDEEFELALAAQIIMLSPITPHLSSELWAGFCSVSSSPQIRKDLSLLEQSWPEVDSDYQLQMRCTMLPGNVLISVDIPRKDLDILTESTAMEALKKSSEMQKYLDGKAIDSIKVESIFPGLSASVNIWTILTRTKEEQKEINKRKKEERKLKKAESKLKKEERRLKSEEKKLKHEQGKKQKLKKDGR